MADQNIPELDRDRDPMDEDMVGQAEEGDDEFEEGDELEEDDEAEEI